MFYDNFGVFYIVHPLNIFYFSFPLTGPNAPDSLVFPRVAKDSLRAIWSESDGNREGYVLCYHPQGTVQSPISSGLLREVSLTGLSTETEYTVSVYAVVGTGENMVTSEMLTRVQETCKLGNKVDQVVE